MGISTVTRVLAVCLLCIGLAMSTGCGGDNGSDEVVLVPDSTIQGNVAQVVAALQAPRAQPTYWARWQEFFRLVPTVQAQQTGNLAGIVVVARQGTLLATATTDATGNFILRVASGAVTLTFTTATFTVSTDLVHPRQQFGGAGVESPADPGRGVDPGGRGRGADHAQPYPMY